MSAAELRKAAETLRDRAGAATPGPWSAEICGGGGPCAGDHGDGVWSAPATTDVFRDETSCSTGDARYIATMHPGVGMALADWLDTAGADYFAFGDSHSEPSHDPCVHCDDNALAPHLRRALTLARLINGGA